MLLSAAALSAWSSGVYDHYNIELRRNLNEDNSPKSMSYVFVCKTHPEHHSQAIVRARNATSVGTSNLRKDVERCLAKQGQPSADPAPKRAESIIPFSEANHRALIALRTAKYARPANMVNDEEYKLEVDMLRPGVVPPSPSTVQRDLTNIYLAMSSFVKNYFLVC